MKRNFARFLPALALAMFLPVISAPGMAQASPTPQPQASASKVAVVNIQGAIFGCNEGQRDLQALQKQFEPKKLELDNLNKEVDDLKKQYSAQGDKLNQDARDNLLKQIDAKQKQYQRNLEDAQGDFNQQQQEIVNRIGKKMLQVLDKYAKENAFSVVLEAGTEQSNVLWATEAVNITPALVAAYNTESGVAAPPKPASTTSPVKPGAAAKPPAGTASARPNSKPKQ
ncbi:MAG TPA: OmpH family outer membrane protein [Terriglobales bacterium]|nr:OmpH family outer membrane protein [Terriglobales bacterium]